MSGMDLRVTRITPIPISSTDCICINFEPTDIEIYIVENGRASLNTVSYRRHLNQRREHQTPYNRTQEQNSWKCLCLT